MNGRRSVASYFLDFFTGPDESNIPSAAELNETLPVKPPVWLSDPNFTVSSARLTWLGHATTLAEIDGSAILTDPVFSARASAVQFAGPKRYTAAACKVKELPPLAAVLVSHNHYDHVKGGQIWKDEGATLVSHIEAYDYIKENPSQDLVLPAVVPGFYG